MITSLIRMRRVDRRYERSTQPADVDACSILSAIIRPPPLDDEAPLREHSGEAMLKPLVSVPG